MGITSWLLGFLGLSAVFLGILKPGGLGQDGSGVIVTIFRNDSLSESHSLGSFQAQCLLCHFMLFLFLILDTSKNLSDLLGEDIMPKLRQF